MKFFRTGSCKSAMFPFYAEFVTVIEEWSSLFSLLHKKQEFSVRVYEEQSAYNFIINHKRLKKTNYLNSKSKKFSIKN